MAESTVETAPGVLSPPCTSSPKAASRELYIDRLRSVMTGLVVLHHTAITYGAPGGWFYNELKPSASLTSTLLTLFVATNQAYFMGFFFLLAGYFTPPSLERKGYGRFLADRFLRLGLPLLVFVFLLGPLTVAIMEAYRGKGFLTTLVYLWKHEIIWMNGPLWFAQALLIFTLGYCVWRAVIGAPLARVERVLAPVPSARWWIVSALTVGGAALAIRQFVPVGVNIAGLQLGYFASYVFLFATGITAWRHDWLRRMEWKHARVLVAGLIVTWPLMPVGIFIAHALYGPGKASFSGGFSWPAILYALWEPFVAWGLIAACLLFSRRHLNQPSSFWAWLNRRAYAVYIIHPPVLVAISLFLHSWAAPALVKFTVTGALACAACWMIADPLVRLPGVRRVV